MAGYSGRNPAGQGLLATDCENGREESGSGGGRQAQRPSSRPSHMTRHLLSSYHRTSTANWTRRSQGYHTVRRLRGVETQDGERGWRHGTRPI